MSFSINTDVDESELARFTSVLGSKEALLSQRVFGGKLSVLGVDETAADWAYDQILFTDRIEDAVLRDVAAADAANLPVGHHTAGDAVKWLSSDDAMQSVPVPFTILQVLDAYVAALSQLLPSDAPRHTPFLWLDDGSKKPATRRRLGNPLAAAVSAAFRRRTLPALPADRTLLLVSAAVIAGLLIGGAPGLFSQTPAGPSPVIVNSKTVNQVTAAVAKATPSVVTINSVEGENGGSGSGVILSSDGYVLTNAHVITLDGVSANTTVTVKAADGRLYKARVVGIDSFSDLAVVKLSGASGLTPATWADSTKLNVGDVTVAIGSPLGLAGTVTTGIVSALGRSIAVPSSAVPAASAAKGAAHESTPLPVIQTDAAINHGNSGGPLLDSRGNVIGINVAIADAGGAAIGGIGGSIGVGFAIPSQLAKRIAAELIDGKPTTHGRIGATVSNAEDDPDSTISGALVRAVTDGGPADTAGLRVGDIIVSFNGFPVTSANDVVAQTRAAAAGSKATVEFVRGTATIAVRVTVEKLG
jgi:putative serine protease PepD